MGPPGVPVTRSRSARFDALVLDALERLDRRWGAQLQAMEFAVEDVPSEDPPVWTPGVVPLARALPAVRGERARVIVYRRPLETRATGRHELAALVHDVVVEQVAELLGLTPDEVDPDWEDPGGH